MFISFLIKNFYVDTYKYMGSFALVFIIHSYSQVYNYQCRKTHLWQFLFHFILLINF